MPSFSSREAQLIATWERERRVVVTVEELAGQVGDGSKAASIARRLAKKGALQRVAKGRYVVVPLRRQLRPTAVTPAVQVGALLAGTKYYLGGLWAVTFHKLSEQQYAHVLDAFISTERHARQLRLAVVHFHRLEPSLLDYGITTAVVEGLTIYVSDLERTLLDGVDRPRVFAGIDVGVERLAAAIALSDRQKLIDYAARGSKPSTCQRLGLLLQRAGVSRTKLQPLRRKAAASQSLLSMLPGRARKGRVDPDWQVVENDR